MAKGSKKKTANRSTRTGRGGATESENSDDDGVGSVAGVDNASVVSMQGSDGGGSTIQDGVGGAAVDTASSEEVFENKMKDAIELATQKSAAGRTKALEAMGQGLLKRLVAKIFGLAGFVMFIFRVLVA